MTKLKSICYCCYIIDKNKLTSFLASFCFFLYIVNKVRCHPHVLKDRVTHVKDKCQFGNTEGLLDLRKSPKPKLLNSTPATYANDCEVYCCRTSHCNTYIWRQKEKHCYLFFCLKLEKCSVTSVKGSITGVLLQDHSISKDSSGQWSAPEVLNGIPVIGKDSNSKMEQIVTVDEGRKDAVSKPNTNDISDIKGNEDVDENTNEISEAAKNEKRLDEKGNKIDEEDNKRDEEDNKRQMPSVSSNAIHLNTISGTNSTINANKTELINETVETTNTSQPRRMHVSVHVPGLKKSHTTTTSLIAALCFGVMFSVAVMYMVGKPWLDSLIGQKSGYHQVTFLMNGIT